MTSSAGAKVLIADDNAQIRKVVSHRLSDLGYTVIEAGDGLSALELAAQELPIVAILDVMMPEKNGWEVARALRENELTQHIKILMLTAIGPRINEATSTVFGADDYLDKPFELPHLEEKIAELVSAAESA